MKQTPKTSDPPGGEAARLAALYRYNILDTPPEAAFDRVVRLAARELNAPSAFLSFVDSERLWFKANYNWAARQGKREASFCDTVVSCNDVLVVTDARQDERFAAHPAVTGAPGIRFYVGVPLRTRDNQTIGTLSVADTEPRGDIDDDERATLQDLAAMVIDELELRREVVARRQADRARDDSEQTLHAVVNEADDLIYMKDHERRYTFVNRAFNDTLGLASEDVIGKRNDELSDTVVSSLSDDYDDEVMRTGAAKTYEITVPLSDGARILEIRKVAHRSARGEVIGVIGIARDVTAQRQASARQRMMASAVEHAAEAILMSTPDLADPTTVFVNPAYTATTGYEADEVIGQTPPLFQNAEVWAAVRERLERGESCRGETVREHRDGPILPTSYYVTTVHDEQGRLSNLLVVQRDLSEHHQTQERLRLLESAVVHANDAVIVTEAEPTYDLEPRILYVNPAFSDQTGYAAPDILGKSPEVLLGEESDLGVLRGARKRLARGESVQAEMVQYRRDGGPFWAEVSINPVADGQGGYSHWVAVQRDISERKEAEAQLGRYTRRLNDILESITDAFFALDHDWRFTYINQEAETVLGRTRAELLGTTLWDAFPETVGSVFEEKYRRAVREDRTLTFTSFYAPLEKWFEVSAYPSDEGLSVFFDDVTERRRYERELKERNDTLRSFYNSAAVMMGTVEISDDDIVHITDNAATHAFFKTDADTMEGRSARELGVPDEHIEIWLEAYRRSLATNQPVRFEYEHRWPTEHRWLSATVNHIGPGPTGRPRCSYVVNDITDRKAALNALQQAKDEAERANQAKSDFLSRMSHELRTPLTAILGFSQLLQLSDLSEEDADNVDDVYKAGKHLLELINEVLDIARIESGRMSLSVEPVRLREVLTESLELVRPLGDDRAIRFDIALEQQPDLYVMADHQRLKQVVLNLLSNAIKYNRHGGTVSLTVTTTPSGSAQIDVRDTGQGISPDKQARLFEAFERLGVEQLGIEGSGLGLALSKNLIELMGGTVAVDSVVDEGSTFSVTLPLSEASAPHTDEVQADPDLHTPVDDTKHRILYIEDNLSNLKLITRILAQRPEIELMSAMQGSLGVTLARQHRPDVVLLDLHLPDISGEDVLRELQTHEATADIPVVVISADATARQISRLTEQGAYAYLTKPIDVAQLLETLRELLETDEASDAKDNTGDDAHDGANGRG